MCIEKPLYNFRNIELSCMRSVSSIKPCKTKLNKLNIYNLKQIEEWRILLVKPLRSQQD